jgi:hypothetical protein
MAFISEKVKKNSQKCKQCAFLKMRNTKMSKYNVFYESAVLSIEGIFRASCAMCPFEPDFEKVYGMMPCEYFPMKKIK